MEATQPRSSGTGERVRGRDAPLHYRPGTVISRTVHPAFIGGNGLLACVLVGLLAGLLSMLLKAAIYGAEDAFQRLPIHWMWWPPMGGVVIGIGGLIFPQALGVGYDTIARVLRRPTPVAFILGILVVKALIWSISLGSGASGGVLAPLLMLGGALGGLEAMFLPGEGVGFWPLVRIGRGARGNDAFAFDGSCVRPGADSQH